MFGNPLGYKVFVKFYDELNNTEFYSTIDIQNTGKKSVIPELNPENDGVSF